ncbi:MULTISPECIES: hypothetical protein [unclassified Roseitalea]|uniref:hypothetical protein n=1 Tax=unclassified Roseitalea TaxID=2639107 RepID=UPI00273D7F9A|nr:MULTISPECIES: hypothetical protein [unclassified Roseitalea]
MRRIGSIAGLIAAFIGLTSGMGAAQDVAVRDRPALTAGYAFSAELGGFRITGLSGLGTRTDPVRIDSQVFSATPVTLVIRATKPINPFAHPRTHATGTLHFEFDITNASGIAWIGAEFELQEVLGEPSVYGDGLSFDQRRIGSYPVTSDRFAGNRQDFEPHDRILFEDGFVDPGERVVFRFLTTDLTPARIFYLRFDPRIPAS